MFGLYFLAIRLYVCVLKGAALFSPKAKLWVEGRRNWRQRLQAAMPANQEVCWMHCASLGEFEQGRPVIEAIRKQNPELFVLITFFSPSGYEIRKNYPLAGYVCYLPADLPENISAFLDIANPKLALFIKYEFWFGFLNGLATRGIPSFLLASRFRPEQHFFKNYGGWFRKQLKQFKQIHVQDQLSADLLNSIGYSPVFLSGDTRYDRVSDNAASPKRLPEIEKWLHGRDCLVAGSTWPVDDPLILPWTERNWALIVAPHEIHESRIRQVEDAAGVYGVRYSNLDNDPEGHKTVLIIDNIGMLMSIYALGKIAYVGGGFGKSLHNILEPAACGLPVIFGPQHSRFPEAAALEKAGGGKSVNDRESFLETFRAFGNPQALPALSLHCLTFVAQQTGATTAIMNSIRRFLPAR